MDYVCLDAKTGCVYEPLELVGASKPQQILENLKVMEGTGFSEEELRMIDEIVGV